MSTWNSTFCLTRVQLIPCMVWHRNFRPWEISTQQRLILSLMYFLEKLKKKVTRNSSEIMSPNLTQMLCEKKELNDRTCKNYFNLWDYQNVCTRKTTNCPTVWNPQELRQRSPTTGKIKLYTLALIATEKYIVLDGVKPAPSKIFNKDPNLFVLLNNLPSLIKHNRPYAVVKHPASVSTEYHNALA